MRQPLEILPASLGAVVTSLLITGLGSLLFGQHWLVCYWFSFICSQKSEKPFDVRLIHADHSKQICGITAPYKLYDSVDETVNLRSLNEFKVWTASNDRWIICSSLGPDRKTYASYLTFGDKVEFFAVSPIDPYK